MQADYDVVVIGSGFGGAITACRLAQAGQSVCVLERGKRWEAADFPRSPGEVADAFWRRTPHGREPGNRARYGFLEYKTFKRMDVIQGVGVGGGSLHYFNVNLRTPEHIFRSPWPEQITRQVLDPYYALAESMLESSPLRPPPGRDFPGRTRAFMKAAKAAGHTPELVPIAVHTGYTNGVDTGLERLNPYSDRPQSACDYSGDCMLGCVQQAKNTLDLNYLPVAASHGAEVYPLHQATRIAADTSEGYTVYFQRLFPDDALRQTKAGRVHGKKVVVAAGTLGTNELLLQCRDVHHTLPNLSPALGRRFSGNGDFLLAATRDVATDFDVDPGRGPSITSGADFSTADNTIYIEDLGYPNPFMWMLEGIIPTSSRFTNLLRAGWTYLLDSLGVGQGGRISFEAERLFSGGATTRLLPYLGMGTDAADGRLCLKDNAIDLDWRHRASKQMFKEIEDGLKTLSRGLNGKYVPSLLWHWPVRKLLTAHPMGGCVMSENPATGVVSPEGQVWGYPQLYVADASIIPTALAVNPSLTISALAERIAFRMLHDREMEVDDPATPENRRKPT